MAALMQAAEAIKYKHCNSIRLWKTKCEDEGVRWIAKYLVAIKTVLCLELLDANMTSGGCEILGSILHQKYELNLLVLKLDHNPIGSKGLKALAKGISSNKTLSVLTLTYCKIDKDAAESLFEICIY